MDKKNYYKHLIGILIIILLTACSRSYSTDDWDKFSIEEAPGFDIQFLVPPDWETNYILPMEIATGQWQVTLTPPRCSPDQASDYEEDCVTLTAYIKGEAEFDEKEVLALISQNIPLSQENNAESILMGQSSFDVNELTIQRFDHKIPSSSGDVQLSYYYFQTDKAYYTLMAHFPYDERDKGTAEQFQQVLQTITKVD